MIDDDDGSMWVPSSIQRLIKHLPSSSFGKATNVDEEMWAYVRITENTIAYKILALSYVTVRVYCQLRLKISV